MHSHFDSFCLLGIFILALTLPQPTHSQDQNEWKSILETVISEAKNRSVYTKEVDWPKLEKKMLNKAKHAKQLEDIKPALETLFNELGDHHGSVRRADNFSILAALTEPAKKRVKDNRSFDPKVWKIVNNIRSKFEYRLLDGNIGYLKVVGIGPNLNGAKEAQRIRSSIIELENQGAKKWVLDLRYNGGGNVEVMLAGLAPLLKEGKVANIVDSTNKVLGVAEIKNGNFRYFRAQRFPTKGKLKNPIPKIAVLTSRWTVSSGELVAVAFRGQKNVRSFGEPTGGYTTNNNTINIQKKILLILSTGYYQDRTGKVYKQFVKPDQTIPFSVHKNPKDDPGVTRSVRWLKAKTQSPILPSRTQPKHSNRR